jgi:hypothetical protein
MDYFVGVTLTIIFCIMALSVFLDNFKEPVSHLHPTIFLRLHRAYVIKSYNDSFVVLLAFSI